MPVSCPFCIVDLYIVPDGLLHIHKSYFSKNPKKRKIWEESFNERMIRTGIIENFKKFQKKSFKIHLIIKSILIPIRYFDNILLKIFETNFDISIFSLDDGHSSSWFSCWAGHGIPWRNWTTPVKVDTISENTTTVFTYLVSVLKQKLEELIL